MNAMTLLLVLILGAASVNATIVCTEHCTPGLGCTIVCVPLRGVPL